MADQDWTKIEASDSSTELERLLRLLGAPLTEGTAARILLCAAVDVAA